MRRRGSIVLALVLITVFCVVAIPTASACDYGGCTPGYWKQAQHFDSWDATGYQTHDSFDAVFGVPSSGDWTLLEALKAKGGGEKALARHAAAALLNASNPDVYYAYSATEVMALVQHAYATGYFEAVKNLLEYHNEIGCPF